jgi:hypothetical protein
MIKKYLITSKKGILGKIENLRENEEKWKN